MAVHHRSILRRSVLTGTCAVVVASVVEVGAKAVGANAASGTPDPVIALDHQLAALAVKCDAAMVEIGVAPDDDAAAALERRHERLMARRYEVEAKLMNTIASSPAGLLAQLQLLMDDAANGDVSPGAVEIVIAGVARLHDLPALDRSTLRAADTQPRQAIAPTTPSPADAERAMQQLRAALSRTRLALQTA